MNSAVLLKVVDEVIRALCVTVSDFLAYTLDSCKGPLTSRSPYRHWVAIPSLLTIHFGEEE